MPKGQLFIIICTAWGDYYALPTALSGTPFLQALPHLRKVKSTHKGGEYVYIVDEDTPNPIEIKFAPIHIPEAEKPTDALPSGDDNPLEPGDEPGQFDDVIPL